MFKIKKSNKDILIIPLEFFIKGLNLKNPNIEEDLEKGYFNFQDNTIEISKDKLEAYKKILYERYTAKDIQNQINDLLAIFNQAANSKGYILSNSEGKELYLKLINIKIEYTKLVNFFIQTISPIENDNNYSEMFTKCSNDLRDDISQLTEKYEEKYKKVNLEFRNRNINTNEKSK
jgi:hypothetical protein